MKHIIIILCITLTSTILHAQSINWTTPNTETSHMAYLNLGYDFGVTTQIGYGYKIETFNPLWLTVDYAMPMGKKLTDDFKIRVGGDLLIYETKGFAVSAALYGNFKRHETSFIRMAGFGSDISTTVGYYKPKWHIQGELGFSKSIINHLKHSEQIQENYDAIKDGWFLPSGGHWFYGIQFGKTIGQQFLLSLDLGVTNAQGKDVNALLPIYAKLGVTKTFD